MISNINDYYNKNEISNTKIIQNIDYFIHGAADVIKKNVYD